MSISETIGLANVVQAVELDHTTRSLLEPVESWCWQEMLLLCSLQQHAGKCAPERRAEMLEVLVLLASQIEIGLLLQLGVETLKHRGTGPSPRNCRGRVGGVKPFVQNHVKILRHTADVTKIGGCQRCEGTQTVDKQLWTVRCSRCNRL